MNTIIAFIIIFGALVFFHELGHLIFAKRAGILCREFAIGFGPKVFSFRKAETNYTIRLLPIGGFVRMAGEDPEMVVIKPGQIIGVLFNKDNEVEKIIVNRKDQYPDARIVEVEKVDIEHEMFISGYMNGEEDRLQRFSISKTSFMVADGMETQIAPYERQFSSKSLFQRTITIAAGPIANFLLAFVVLVTIGILQGYAVNKPILGELTNEGAAYEAGLQQGDKIQAIDNEPIDTWTDVVAIIKQSPSKDLTFTINRDGETITVPVTPKVAEDGTGLIGVYGPLEKSFFGAIQNGFIETVTLIKEITLGLFKLIAGQFSIDMLSGPVGIYSYTEQVAQSGVYYLMKWGAVLSINLGIFNLLPLPALDGGRLLFFTLEALRGKPIDRQKENMVHFIGFALLMLLMLVVTWNDIQKFFL